MSVNSILKKEEISIVRELDTLEVNRIAKNISDKIINAFSEFLIDYQELFSSICRINMYLAKMPSDSAIAKYSYKNNSIYFNENIDLSIAENSIFALHECIHFLQVQKNQSGNLIRLGLYESGGSGTSINEAAVQYMAAIAQGLNFDSCKYYDINLNTISPDCYPLQCALLNEMVYFTDTYPLYQSTLNSTDVFKNTFISTSDKKTYSKIEVNLDKLLKLEDDLYEISLKISNTEKSHDLKVWNKLTQVKKENIKKIFFDTQNLIIQSCFTNQFNHISTLEDVQDFQGKLYNFKNILGYSDDYNFYNEFYCNTMTALDSIRKILESNGNLAEYRSSNTSLTVVYSSNKFVNLFKMIIQKVSKLFNMNKPSTQKNFEKN